MIFFHLAFCDNKDKKPSWLLMATLSNIKNSDVLPEFQAFFLNKKLASEKNVFFYALWTSKYLNYANKKQIPPDQYRENILMEFIETIKSNSGISDWQVRQAGDAIRLYYFHEILKLEYPVLWTGMKSFPAEGRGDLCYF